MSADLVQNFSIYVQAPAEQVWAALTESGYTERWGYGGGTVFEPEVGGVYRNLATEEMKQMGLSEVAVDGRVVEIEVGRRLVLEWKPMWHPDSVPTRLTWELEQFPGGLTRLLLTHDVSANPALAAEVAGNGDPDQGGGGWPWSLSGLKTLLETGAAMGVPAV